jgi:hypothetical protein
MLKPLPTYQVRVHRLDPTLAEVHIQFADLPTDVDVCGRLTGPRCPGVSTVEIAYPLQKLASACYRVLIPEPVCWTAMRPFVYEGNAAFRRQGIDVGSIKLSFGIKMSDSAKP